MKTLLIVLLPLGLLGVFFIHCSGSRPGNLGINDGRLAPCPDSPNCVSTFADDSIHGMQPLSYAGTVDDAMERLISIVKKRPRTKIITANKNYLYAEFTSRIWRFVDDIEFFADTANKLIHFRSASRLGHSDMGVNRDRMASIAVDFHSTH